MHIEDVNNNIYIDIYDMHLWITHTIYILRVYYGRKEETIKFAKFVAVDKLVIAVDKIYRCRQNSALWLLFFTLSEHSLFSRVLKLHI